MRKVYLLIGICILAAFAITLWAQAIEEQLSPVMKDVAATQGSLRKNLDAKSAADVEKDATKLQGLFEKAQGIFKAAKVGDAAKAAKANAEAAGEVIAAAKQNNLDAAATPAGAIQKSCKGCHDIHREQLPDKTYKFK